MPKYIFLDNWVYSLLLKDGFEERLTAFVKQHDYTIIITSLSLAELYNPQWITTGDKDRMYRAVRFLSKSPSVIIDPQKVFQAEINSYPDLTTDLPIELDLKEISYKQRSEVLLMFLRRDKDFLDQGKDIQEWQMNYENLKSAWQKDIDAIITNAYDKGVLQRKGSRKSLYSKEEKEMFLMSLDLRQAESSSIDSLIKRRMDWMKNGKQLSVTAIRLVSLCFWYAYVNIDHANKIKRKGSDIGDFYHISLIPYCVAFTTDNAMQRLLSRIYRTEPNLRQCEILNKRRIESLLST